MGMDIYPDDAKLRYKKACLRKGTDDVSESNVNSVITALTSIAIEFDYGVFGNEFQMLNLYLSI